MTTHKHYRHAKVAKPLQSPTEESSGFSLPLILVTALILLLGGLALADRANQGLFGALFINQSLEAREAAKVGMTRIVSELNKPRNRGLLVRRSDNDTGNWTSSNLSDRRNICLASTPSANLPTLANLDPNNGSTTNYGSWFIAEDGSISSNAGNARRSYRLVSVTREAIDTHPLGNVASSFLLRVFGDRPSPDQRRFILQVEGRSIRNGVTTASVILEKQFELTPKCCNVPFGGAHGNLDYANESLQLCAANLGLGLLGGTSGTNTGSITLNGSSSTFTTGTAPISTIYCLASNQAGCAIAANGNQSVSIDVINRRLSPAYTYANPTTPITPGYNTSLSGSLAGYSNNESATSDPTKFKYCTSLSNNGKCAGITVFNADVTDLSSLPSSCKLSADSSEVHCNVSQLTYGEIFFKASSRKLRLYFPSSASNPVISRQGSGFLLACSAVSSSATTTSGCTPSNSVTDVALFGCQSCTPQQQVQLGNGNLTNGTLDIFAYFPSASVTLSGNSNFRGILWTDDITSNGGVTWTVPGSGLASVFGLMGMNPQTGNNPILFDYVLRGTDYQRWIGG